MGCIQWDTKKFIFNEQKKQQCKNFLNNNSIQNRCQNHGEYIPAKPNKEIHVLTLTRAPSYLVLKKIKSFNRYI